MVELLRKPLSHANPWPGLDSFDESDRAYFYGRTAELDELVRMVRREPLTVLFGRSGLGKTSLLKAGLLPLLREEDCMPVYVRLDHTDGAPSLREQIFHGLQIACAADRIEATGPVEAESLWSFFHRRDAEFRSEHSRQVTPVIVFDQFEEIFTLGQETGASQARSAAFLAELGDLVENRLPDAVRQELEVDPTAARRFDSRSSKVKLVLSLREDFLAEIEGLKASIPSLMYNRFRLLAMSGTQAFEAITGAGGTMLVADEVARRIIRLAWKNEPSPPVDPAEFPRIEIDPSLLSVVCSELNYKRQQAEPPLDRITRALLEGADQEILSGFYERSMAGLDSRVRAFVEDELITDRGYRDSYALEDALALPGITFEALDALILRRLLRVDERRGVRRIELAHDVLTRVVMESRDWRRAREVEDAAISRELATLKDKQSKRIAEFLVAGAFIVIVLMAFAGRFSWEARRMREQANELLHEAEITRLMANADRLQDVNYDASLLVNLEAVGGGTSTLDAQAGLLRRFMSHPHLSIFLLRHKDSLGMVAFSPNGKWLASAGDGNTVILWDLEKHKPLAALKGHKGMVNSLAFSPDGKQLASASKDKTVTLWDIEGHKALATLREHKDVVNSVAFSPDGKRLASASDDKTVILWDVESRKALAVLKGHEGRVTSVAFSPNGKQLASASTTIILWDVESRKPLATLGERGSLVPSIAFSPDGKLLASARQDKVILWDAESRKLLATLNGHKEIVSCVAFSPDGKQLASASWDTTVILWNVVGRLEPLATLNGHRSGAMSVAFSPDGKHLVSASWDTTVIWDLESRKLLATLEGHKGWVQGVAFSPDGKLLASASRDRTVILWDVESRRLLATLEGHKGWVHSIAFSPDGKRLASASDDKSVILWDVDNRRLLAVLDGHKDEVWGVAFSPDGRQLASASKDKTVILWDLDNRRPRAVLSGHKDEVFGVSFSPDGKRLASASKDSNVILWDVEDRKPLITLKENKGEVSSVVFSPDGTRLALANSIPTVTLWNAVSGKPLGDLEGHEQMVLSVAFSPDGQRLASASADETVILWDLDNRQLLARLEGHKYSVWGVAFSPNGKLLASAGADHTIILWDLGLDNLKAEACRTANRNLTCDEWRNYIGADKPYHKTCEALPGPPEKCD